MMKATQYVLHSAKVLFLGALVLFTTGCDHDTDPVGPNLVDRFGPFAVNVPISASTQTVDFSQGQTVIFSGEFNKNLDWIIKIEGLESGAVKRIEGFDRFIGEQNARWDGGVSDLPFFSVEQCRVTISVPEEPDYGDTLQLEITGLKQYDGSLFTDFESEPGNNIRIRDFQFEFNLAETGRRDAGVIPPAQGDFSLVLTGSDNAQDPFVGLIEVYAALSGNTYMQLPSNVPGDVFFNCFLYSDGRPHTIAIIQLVIDSNENGIFDDGQDPTFQPEEVVAVSWTGWQLYSLTLEDFGINEDQMDRILLARVLLISDLANNPRPPDEVQFGVDFMTFTQGTPLEL